jgi:hypothetical protein
MNTKSVYTFLSFITKAIAIIIVYGFSLKTLNSNDYSLFLLLMIMYRFKDVFDFGVLDNYSRKVSYSNTDNSVSYSIVERYKPHYFKKSLLTLIIVMLLVSLVIKSKDYEISNMLGFISIYSLLFSMYIMSNYYIGLLYGLNKIIEIRKYDFIFNLLQVLVFSLIFNFFDVISIFYIFLVLTSFQFFVLCRLYYFYKRYVNVDYFKKQSASNHNDSAIRDKANNTNDFIQYKVMSISVFLCNWYISHYFDSKLTNIYFTLEAITEQLKNFSKIPFYLFRPNLSKYSKNDVDGIYQKSIDSYLSFMYKFLTFGFVTGFLMVLIILFNIDFFSKLARFDISVLYLWIYFLITVFVILVDRFIYFHIEKYIIENDRVISHYLVIFNVMLFIPLFFLIFNFYIPFYFIAFLFSLSMTFSFLLLRLKFDF